MVGLNMVMAVEMIIAVVDGMMKVVVVMVLGRMVLVLGWA